MSSGGTSVSQSLQSFTELKLFQSMVLKSVISDGSLSLVVLDVSAELLSFRGLGN